MKNYLRKTDEHCNNILRQYQESNKLQYNVKIKFNYKQKTETEMTGQIRLWQCLNW
jgi:hypothetical protein